MPEYRKGAGIRHRLPTVLVIAVAAKLAGVRGFVDQLRCPHDALAVDGKSADGELMRGHDKERTLVAAIEHASGLAIGQVASSTGGGEILGARPRPLGDREPPPLRPRHGLRRGPKPGAGEEPEVQRREPSQRRDL